MDIKVFKYKINFHFIESQMLTYNNYYKNVKDEKNILNVLS